MSNTSSNDEIKFSNILNNFESKLESIDFGVPEEILKHYQTLNNLVQTQEYEFESYLDL